MTTVQEMIASLREEEAQRVASWKLGIAQADIGANKKTLAKLLSVHESTVSRWGNKPVPKPHERKFNEFRRSVLTEIGIASKQTTNGKIRWIPLCPYGGIGYDH